MSYILDALKKADAERERGTVPGLLSQPQAPAPEEPGDTRRLPPPAVWMAMGVGLCLVAVLGWHLATREPLPDADGASSPAVPLSQSPNRVAPIESTATPAPVQSPLAQAESNVPEAHRAERPRVRVSAVSELPPRTPELTVSRNTSRHESPSARDEPAAPALAHQSDKSTQRIPTLQELPEDVRRDIPRLTIGGAMYSDTPSARMLVINSQVFHEGDKPYQGLVLEEIRLKSAVFSYRGYRYSINY